jgi:peptide chain release factor subunit 1
MDTAIPKVKTVIVECSAGTSMISLIIPPKVRPISSDAKLDHANIYTQDQIARVSAMLTQEYGTASNIKSRVNRLSVLAAITSTQQRLKLYNRVPPNGLVLFVGTILTDEGKEKKVSFDFEPHKPINTSV